MGMRSKSSSCCSSVHIVTLKEPPNPDPKNFKILSRKFNGAYTRALVKYPDCSNYEGIKILVFKGDVVEQLDSITELDPHFCNGDHLSPIARFKPDAEGIMLANNLK